MVSPEFKKGDRIVFVDAPFFPFRAGSLWTVSSVDGYGRVFVDHDGCPDGPYNAVRFKHAPAYEELFDAVKRLEVKATALEATLEDRKNESGDQMADQTEPRRKFVDVNNA